VGNQKGFSLVEVLAGMMIFAFGMLGVAALLVTTVRDNSFSGSMSEANLMMASKIDELLSKSEDYNTEPELKDRTGESVLGLAYAGCPAGSGTCTDEPDFNDLDQGKNGKFDVYWNIATDSPVVNTKTIGVVVKWTDRDSPKKVSCRVIMAREY